MVRRRTVEVPLCNPLGCPPGSGGESQPRAAGEDELQRPLQVPVGGLQHPQHKLLVLDAHVPELLDLGLPAALEPKAVVSLVLVTPPRTPDPL